MNGLLRLCYIFTLLVASLEEARSLQITRTHIPEKCLYKALKGDLIHVRYQASLSDGTEFDASRKIPLIFRVGRGQVIEGFDDGVVDMCLGEIRTVEVPPALAFGARGAPPKIPPNETLIFSIKLIHIERILDLNEMDQPTISDQPKRQKYSRFIDEM